MSNRLDEIQKLTFTGAVDADGHILEDAGLWDRYIEAKYKDRAVRVRKDDKGLEYLEVAGKPSKVFNGGRLGGLSAMGATRNDKYDAPPTYGGFAPFGAMDAKERLKRIDAEGLAAAFLYPTMSLLWETETDDPELAQACTRAYNRYIVDFCSDSGGKLIPIAHLSLGDPAAAAVELERAVKDGCKGGWVAQFVMTRKPHAHPDHDVLFAKAQELDVPLGIHPSLEPVWAAPGRYDRKFMRGNYYFLNIVAADAIRHAFTSFFQYSTFDKFPKMRLVLLEAGAGWIDYWLGASTPSMRARWAARCRSRRSRASTLIATAGSRRIPTSARCRRWSSCAAPTNFSGPRTSRIPITSATISKKSRSWRTSCRPVVRAKVMGENVMKVYKCALPR